MRNCLYRGKLGISIFHYVTTSKDCEISFSRYIFLLISIKSYIIPKEINQAASDKFLYQLINFEKLFSAKGNFFLKFNTMESNGIFYFSNFFLKCVEDIIIEFSNRKQENKTRHALFTDRYMHQAKSNTNNAQVR